MLIQFSVTNWRSIKDEQTISMVMATGKEMSETNTFLPTAPNASELLRSVAIYGANAAGKSNLLKALEIMQEIVVESAKGQHGEELPIVPFLLDTDTEQAPSEFEVIFIADGIRYQYGFAANSQRITEEWLMAFPLGRTRKWFARDWDANNNEYVWDNKLSGPKQIWQDSTRQNALFLSTAVQLNCTQLQPIYNWFSKILRLTNVSGWAPSFTASLCKEQAQREQVLDFLKAADLDIHDVIVEPEKLTAKHLPSDMPDDIKNKVLIEHKDQLVYDIKTIHQSKQGHSVAFDFDDESDGTRKFFAFAGPWLDSLKHGYVLCIDELHDNLHPKMVQFLVSLFHNNQTNPNNAQLIFTTHETSILNQDVFRRDQIWFCEKGKDQATKVFPLTDFNPRKGRENLEANYLSGRYGALPYVRSLTKVKSA